MSSVVNVTSGVPQGSILGPLLFNIAMNSMFKLPLSPNAGLTLYADDVLLSKPVDSTQDVNQLQQDVDRVLQWMNSQGLTANHTIPKPNMLILT